MQKNFDNGKLICTVCHNVFSLSEKIWRCGCGGLLDIDFAYKFSPNKIKLRKPTMWRYREAIPIHDDKNIITFDEGLTPLLPIDFNSYTVLIKQDHLMQSGSFKDRGASVLISKVKELGIKKIIIDSSGNAGCAVAAYCAKANIECNVFVPANSSPAKLRQIESYGANLIKIIGSRESTARAALRAAEKDYYASHYWNPFFMHGIKTFAFEVCEQLQWKTPDLIILPVGNGTLLLGSYIGFNELYNYKVINEIPKIIGVQSVSCAPLVKAFKDNLDEVPTVEKKDTIAEGIAINKPIRGKQIIEAIKKSGGDLIAVSDDEIKIALKEIFQKGFYIEPTAAATIAGLKKYLGQNKSDKVIVSVFTGHGLKHIK